MKIAAKEKYSFGLGALGKDLVYGLTATFAMIYFTDALGVNASFVGIVFFAARFWDAINDLLCGVIVDNTKNKFGKFRTWLVIGTLSNAVVLCLMFTDFGFSGTSLYIYVAVSYVLWGMTYTLMDIPYWSMLPNFSSDKLEREKIAVLPRIFASIGNTLIIGGLGMQIINYLGGDRTSVGYSRFAYTIALVFVVTIGITVLNVRTPDKMARKAESQDKEKLTLKRMKNVILKNDQLIAAIGVIVSYNASMQLMGAASTYYFIYVCGSKGMFAVFMSFAAIAEISGLFLFPKVASIISRQHVYLVAGMIQAIGFVLLFCTGIFYPQSVPMTALAGILIKVGGGLQSGTTTVILADVVDYGEYKLKQRNESVIFSLQTLLVKFTSAFGALLVGFVLDMTGYIPNAVQSFQTVSVLRIIMCIAPIAFIVLGYAVYKKKYKLDQSYMITVHKQLQLER